MVFNATNVTNTRNMHGSAASDAVITETFVVTTEVKKINGSTSNISAIANNKTDEFSPTTVINATKTIVTVKETVTESFSNDTAISYNETLLSSNKTDSSNNNSTGVMTSSVDNAEVLTMTSTLTSEQDTITESEPDSGKNRNDTFGPQTITMHVNMSTVVDTVSESNSSATALAYDSNTSNNGTDDFSAASATASSVTETYQASTGNFAILESNNTSQDAPTKSVLETGSYNASQDYISKGNANASSESFGKNATAIAVARADSAIIKVFDKETENISRENPQSNSPKALPVTDNHKNEQNTSGTPIVNISSIENKSASTLDMKLPANETNTKPIDTLNTSNNKNFVNNVTVPYLLSSNETNQLGNFSLINGTIHNKLSPALEPNTTINDGAKSTNNSSCIPKISQQEHFGMVPNEVRHQTNKLSTLNMTKNATSTIGTDSKVNAANITNNSSKHLDYNDTIIGTTNIKLNNDLPKSNVNHSTHESFAEVISEYSSGPKLVTTSNYTISHVNSTINGSHIPIALTETKNITTQTLSISESAANATSISFDGIVFNATNGTNSKGNMHGSAASDAVITETFVVTTEVEKINGSTSNVNAMTNNKTDDFSPTTAINATKTIVTVKEIVTESFSNDTAISYNETLPSSNKTDSSNNNSTGVMMSSVDNAEVLTMTSTLTSEQDTIMESQPDSGKNRNDTFGPQTVTMQANMSTVVDTISESNSSATALSYDSNASNNGTDDFSAASATASSVTETYQASTGNFAILESNDTSQDAPTKSVLETGSYNASQEYISEESSDY
ncbi:uncharacterized protein LOC128670262 isoform X2 [Plodia interpunctella]|uniref:uncharacterized protein LOC128670262 isoform X2 n=1 Tax=Plodia interpunctella TaxID=58824 RepID=UPI002367C87F|nr:uncharacterized protein LOC128670262 isoform X2 [Plodia interpunctella]